MFYIHWFSKSYVHDEKIVSFFPAAEELVHHISEKMQQGNISKG